MRGSKNLAFLIKMVSQVIINLRFYFVVTFWIVIAFAALGIIIF